MSSISKLSRTSRPDVLERLILHVLQGIEAAIPEEKTLDIGGSTYTRDELVAALEAKRDVFMKVIETRAELQRLIQERDKQIRDIADFMRDVHASFVGVLGRTNPEIEKLGFGVPRERRRLTSEELLIRAAKAKITRQLRGTLGKRQKEKIRATGTPTVIVRDDGFEIVPAPALNVTAPRGAEPLP